MTLTLIRSSIADQMDGDPNRHDHYRQRICDYMENNEDDFAPFVEDDRTLAAVRRNFCRSQQNWTLSWYEPLIISELPSLTLSYSIL